jgi:hypothetical protein
MRLEESVEIDRPIDVVWAFLTDTFNAPRIRHGGILGLRLTSPGPPAVGSTLQDRRVVLGFETRFDHEITEWDPPHALTTSIRGVPFRSFIQRLTMEPVSAATRLAYTGEIEPRLFARLLLPIVAPYFRRQAHDAIGDLKRLIEAERPEDRRD